MVAGSCRRQRAPAYANAVWDTMAGYGLVRLERGQRGRITPTVTDDRVELDLPLSFQSVRCSVTHCTIQLAAAKLSMSEKSEHAPMAAIGR